MDSNISSTRLSSTPIEFKHFSVFHILQLKITARRPRKRFCIGISPVPKEMSPSLLTMSMLFKDGKQTWDFYRSSNTLQHMLCSHLPWPGHFHREDLPAGSTCFTHRPYETVNTQHTWKHLHHQQTWGNARAGFQLKSAAGAWPQVTHCPNRELSVLFAAGSPLARCEDVVWLSMLTYTVTT